MQYYIHHIITLYAIITFLTQIINWWEEHVHFRQVADLNSDNVSELCWIELNLHSSTYTINGFSWSNENTDYDIC